VLIFASNDGTRGAALVALAPLQDPPGRFSRRPLAIVTGASSGIGFHLAQRCVDHGFDLLIAADEPAIAGAAGTRRRPGVEVEPLEVMARRATNGSSGSPSLCR